MHYENFFPFWSSLTDADKESIVRACYGEKLNKGQIMHRSEDTCKGLMSVVSGSLRTYIVSEEGREITLFRIFGGEVCVLSASCLMDTIEFDIIIEATEETEVMILPSVVLNDVMNRNPQVELFMYKAATDKFSDVMWTLQQILFKKIDQRVAGFIWDEISHSEENTLVITHDEIARYIGSAREVVTKVLKYLAMCDAIELKRGKIIVKDKNILESFL